MKLNRKRIAINFVVDSDRFLPDDDTPYSRWKAERDATENRIERWRDATWLSLRGCGYRDVSVDVGRTDELTVSVAGSDNSYELRPDLSDLTAYPQAVASFLDLVLDDVKDADDVGCAAAIPQGR
jgi:hypothetical protein